jgi:hypothetical protein
LELNGQIGKNKWLMIKHVLPHEIKRVYLDWYSIMGWSWVEWNKIGWNKINFLFYNLDILKREIQILHFTIYISNWNETKLKVSGGMRWNPFHPIPFHYYFSNSNNRTLFNSIHFHSIPSIQTYISKTMFGWMK